MVGRKANDLRVITYGGRVAKEDYHPKHSTIVECASLSFILGLIKTVMGVTE